MGIGKDKEMNGYFTVARFPSNCPETGRPIKKGDRIAYFPGQRKAYHEDSKTAQELRGQQFARSWGMADANW